MDHSPRILHATINHQRLTPKPHSFRYKVFYIDLPLNSLPASGHFAGLPLSRFAKMSFYPKDHGSRTNTELLAWLTPILREKQLDQIISHARLIAMPRILSYTFNPISFWLCYDAQQNLKAILCEVNNTFGENHSYLCTPPFHETITDQHTFSADKAFHVSPFLPRNGHYQFQFRICDQHFGAYITYFLMLISNGSWLLVFMATGN